MTDLITQLEARVAQLDAERAAILAAIAALQGHAHPAPAPPQARSAKSRQPSARARQDRPARPTGASPVRDRILAALKAGAPTIGAVSQQSGLSKGAVSHQLRLMVKAGQVRATGTTNDRRFEAV